MEDQRKNSPVMLWSAIVVALAVVIYGASKYLKQDSTVVVVPIEVPVTVPVTVPEDKNGMMGDKMGDKMKRMMSSNIYKDGPYTTTGGYFAPSGDEHIGLTVTLKDDVIVDAKVDPKAVNPTSLRFQEIFRDNFKQFVVGRKISEVQLGKVSGSSLTPEGFNDALSKIKLQAKV